MLQTKIVRWFTRRGQEVVPMRRQGSNQHITRAWTDRVSNFMDLNIQYTRCQIMPPVPQRFEWIRSDSLQKSLTPFRTAR